MRALQSERNGGTIRKNQVTAMHTSAPNGKRR